MDEAYECRPPQTDGMGGAVAKSNRVRINRGGGGGGALFRGVGGLLCAEFGRLWCSIIQNCHEQEER